ncbi:hypothetical protein BWQ96_10536 [Gracilariopsis chorda]|uniref:Uncharacterized protein n=1 Tax=Gracilariopsis chorda TaxID=448386 RepID=A0A2V3ICD0_9FLOR|nr:hypothetical protein BWQ96_10536 [Gracilariopsis chorda]|eukprot:PXF39757.1 hypothetical protein BWQ96_10536 [Gracilariopsis chorda]
MSTDRHQFVTPDPTLGARSVIAPNQGGDSTVSANPAADANHASGSAIAAMPNAPSGNNQENAPPGHSVDPSGVPIPRVASQTLPLPPTGSTSQPTGSANLPGTFATPLLGQQYDHCLRRSGSSGQNKQPPYGVEELINAPDLRNFLDAKRFAAIPVRRSFFELTGRNPKRTRGEAWAQRWRHLQGIAGLQSDTTVGSCDMPFLRCPEEYQCQARMRDLIGRMATDVDFPSADSNPLQLVMFSRPYDRMYWLNRRRWGDNIATEARLRSNRDRYMFCWHNIEFFDVSPADREKLYVRAPQNWGEFDVTRDLSVITPPVLAYYSGEVLRDSALSERVMRIAIAEWAVCALMAFLQTASEGVRVFTRTEDPRVNFFRGFPGQPNTREPPGLGRLFPLPYGLVSLVMQMGLENVLRGTIYATETARRWLYLSVMTDWVVTPGYLWFDPRTETFPEMPRIPTDPFPLTHRLQLGPVRPPWDYPNVAEFDPLGGGAAQAMEVAPPEPDRRLPGAGSKEVGTQTDDVNPAERAEELAALTALTEACGRFGVPAPTSVTSALVSSCLWLERLGKAKRVVRGDTLGLIDLMLFIGDLAVDVVERHLEVFGDAAVSDGVTSPAVLSEGLNTAARSLLTTRNRGTLWFRAIRAALRPPGTAPDGEELAASWLPAITTRLAPSGENADLRQQMAAGLVNVLRSGQVPFVQPDGSLASLPASTVVGQGVESVSELPVMPSSGSGTAAAAGCSTPTPMAGVATPSGQRPPTPQGVIPGSASLPVPGVSTRGRTRGAASASRGGRGGSTPGVRGGRGGSTPGVRGGISKTQPSSARRGR